MVKERVITGTWEKLWYRRRGTEKRRHGYDGRGSCSADRIVSQAAERQGLSGKLEEREENIENVENDSISIAKRSRDSEKEAAYEIFI